MSKAKWLVVVAAACIALAAVVAAAWAAGQAAAPRVVRAQRFELVDANGKVRAVLGLTPAARPGLTLFDGKGNPRIDLGMGRDGRHLGVRLYDEKGQTRAGLGLLADGSPALMLFDEQGRPRAGLDEKGDVIWRAPTGIAGTREANEKAPDTGGWVEVASWTGKGMKTTDTFTVRSPWKIAWDTRVGEEFRKLGTSGTFSISVHSADGELTGMAANVQGDDHDESVQHKGGTFYLDIAATGQSYDVKVLQRR